MYKTPFVGIPLRLFFWKQTFMEVLSNEYWKDGDEFRTRHIQTFMSSPYVCKITNWLW